MIPTYKFSRLAEFREKRLPVFGSTYVFIKRFAFFRREAFPMIPQRKSAVQRSMIVDHPVKYIGTGNLEHLTDLQQWNGRRNLEEFSGESFAKYSCVK